MWSVLIFFERRGAILLEEYDLRFEMRAGNLEKPATDPPKTHLNSYSPAFRKFVEIDGITYLSESDLAILHVGGKDWGIAYQRPIKQPEKITASIFGSCVKYVSDTIRDIPERLFARPFRVADASGLRWDDRLNTAPAKTVLMKEGLIGFAEKPKPGGSLRVCHGGQVAMLSLMKMVARRV